LNGGSHEHRLWRVEEVEALVDDQNEGDVLLRRSRSFSNFIDLFDGVFVLKVDLDTLRRRLEQRPEDQFGGRPSDRELTEGLHESGGTSSSMPQRLSRALSTRSCNLRA
jgi:hypothetical protein